MMMQTFGTYNREIMKTKAIQLLCILCAASLLSCEKEKEAPDGLVNTVFSASFDASSQEFYSEDDSKTYRSGSHTLWSAGDQIKVFYSNSTSSTFTLSSGNGTASAQFAGLAPAGKTANYAVYPAGATASRSSDTVVNVTVLENQDGTFASCNYAVSCIHSGNELYFSNITSLMCIQLTSGDVRTVVVESVDGSALRGTLPVTCSSGTVSVDAATSTGSSITVSTSGSGKKYIAILGGVRHAKGLKFTFKNSSGVTTGTYYLNKDFTPVKDKVYNFGDFEPTKAYYVTVSGAGNGNGLSWANAMDKTQMWDMVSLSGAGSDASQKAALIDAINGATFHLGAGTYNLNADPTININESSAVSLTFKGGYPAAGGSQNLASYRANFTGATSHEALKLKGKLNITFEGVGFINGSISYNADHTDGTSQGAGSLDIMGNTTNDMTVTMSNCLVDGNVNASYAGASEYWGAGVFLHCGRLNATNVTFSNNQSHFAPALVTWKGGSYATLTNCTFSSNAAASSGGAVILAFGSNATFNTCTFSGNTAAGSGGAIVTQNTATLTCNSGCSFSSNTAADGGAIMTSGSSAATFTGCTLTGNSSTRGGAVFVESTSTATFNTTTFTGNHSSSEGGAARVTDAATMNVNGCTFGGSASGTYNYSTGTGGAIYVLSAATLNVAKSGSTATVFRGNYTTGSKGGAIRHQSSGALTCTGAQFIGNHSDATAGNNYGGAVCIDNGYATITITDCTFDSNYCAVYGGSALSYQDGKASPAGSLTVNNTTFNGNYNNYSGTDNTNYATYGGAIRLGNDTAKCYFNDCTFTGNHTNETTVASEACSSWGGAITFYGDQMIYLDGCYFEGNYAASGGAIAANKCGGGIFMNACSFKGNYASYNQGAAIRFEKSLKFCMNNCSFYDDHSVKSIAGDKATWVYLTGTSGNTIFDKYVISNCSIIARSSSQIANSGSNDQEIVYILHTKSSGANKGYFINNLIINAGGGGGTRADWWLNTAPADGYNNVWGSKHGTSNCTYSGSSDTSGKTIANLGTLSWTNNTWQWTGLSGYTAISASSFDSYLNTADSDFKTWLTNIGAIHKNQLGTDRGNTNWRPGAW